MKKIVRLSESQLIKLINRIIKEDSTSDETSKCNITLKNNIKVRKIEGNAKVNGKTITKDMSLKAGDKIYMDTTAKIFSHVIGADAPTAAGCYYIISCSGQEKECGD